MGAFATVEDLERRWRPLSEDERDRANELLLDATAYLVALFENSEVEILDENETQKRNLTMVCCAMVHRIMGIDDDMYGVTQYSKTAGSFTESGTAANPNGDMYLTAAEKALLGLSATGKKQKALFIRPAIHRPDGGLIDDW